MHYFCNALLPKLLKTGVMADENSALHHRKITFEDIKHLFEIVTILDNLQILLYINQINP